MRCSSHMQRRSFCKIDWGAAARMDARITRLRRVRKSYVHPRHVKARLSLMRDWARLQKGDDMHNVSRGTNAIYMQMPYIWHRDRFAEYTPQTIIRYTKARMRFGSSEPVNKRGLRHKNAS